MIKKIRKLKVIEVKSRRRYFWAGPMVAVFLAFILIINVPSKVAGQDDYTFGSETVNKGYSVSPTNKNTEDGSFNSLIESDQYADTNFSGSSENIVVGTTGGGSFPSALDTDDATRRNYIEATSGSSNYVVYLFPTGDSSVNWDTVYPASPTTHYDKLDETANGGDSDTTYVNTATNSDRDVFNMADISTPSGSPGFDVQVWSYAKKASSSTANIQFGIVSGGTDYSAFSGNPTTAYVNRSKGWLVDPKDSVEWTITKINALQTYMTTSDASPAVRFTQMGLIVYVNYTASYTLDAQITYSSVASTSQTTGFQVLCQGYRNGDTESVYVQAWNYTSSAWVTKATITASSDTDYNFNLLGWAANCERSSGNVVLLRLVDVTGGDATQTTTYLDLLKIRRIEQGYALDLDMSATAVAQYGNITLRIKGYTSAEQFNVNVWNYTSSAYDMGKLAITSLSNAWQTTIDLCDGHHRSGTMVKIQFVDGIAASSDQVQDTLFLDVVWVTRYHTNPAITKYDGSGLAINYGETTQFWCNYSDYDNEAPTYVYAHIGSTDYSMNANNSYLQYTVGKSYYLTKTDVPVGNTTYYFKVKDANSPDITTTPVAISVNTKPTLTLDGVTPATGNPGDYTFFVTYTDADSNSPKHVKATIGGADYTMDYNGSGGGYHYHKTMAGGTTAYYFKTEDYRSGVVSTTAKNLVVNYLPSLSGYGKAPGDPVYITTELNFTATFTDADNTLPTSIKWREDGGATQNVTMLEVDPADTTTSDGKAYYKKMYLTHGVHNYDFGASDALYWTSGGSNSVTIANRAPTIDNKFVDDHEWRNTYWEYDYSYTDLDGDTVVFQLSTNASFLNINSASGLVYGTTSDPTGWYSATVWCNDSYSGTDSDSFILYVDNREPVITNGPEAHVDQWRNQGWYYVFTASDPDTDTIVWTKSGPGWLSIGSSTGNLSGTTSDTPGLYGFIVYANDSYGGSDSYAFDIHIINRIPSIISTGNASQQQGTYLAYQIIADDDDGDTLGYALSSNASWASLSGIWVNGTATDLGWYEFTIWVNDSYSGSDSEHWHLTVQALPANQAPYFTSTPIYSVVNGSYYFYDVNAFDPDYGPIQMQYSLDTNASFLMINITSGVLNGTAFIVGSYWINVTVSDGEAIAWQFWILDVTPSLGFISIPPQIARLLEQYDYTPLWGYIEAMLHMQTNASWIRLTNGAVVGTPIMKDVGSFWINLTLIGSGILSFQNYTLTVNNTMTAGILTNLTLGLAFGFGLIVLSVIDTRHKIWSVFAGLTWFMISVVAFYPLGLGWMILGVGIGLILWVEGAMEYAAGRKGT